MLGTKNLTKRFKAKGSTNLQIQHMRAAAGEAMKARHERKSNAEQQVDAYMEANPAEVPEDFIERFIYRQNAIADAMEAARKESAPIRTLNA